MEEEMGVEPDLQQPSHLRFGIVTSDSVREQSERLGLNPPYIPNRLTQGRSRGTRMVRLLARCGNCEGCLRGNCGTCKNCLDKPKYGGRGVRKQACLRRVCCKPRIIRRELFARDADDEYVDQVVRGGACLTRMGLEAPMPDPVETSEEDGIE